MQSKCDHIGLLTNNLKRLERFYIQRLGFRKEREEILPESIAQPIFKVPPAIRFVRLFFGDTKLELFEPLNKNLKKVGATHCGYHHWGFCVEDRVAFLKKLRMKGIEVIEVKRDTQSVYFIEDPDGNRIEIRQ